MWNLKEGPLRRAVVCQGPPVSFHVCFTECSIEAQRGNYGRIVEMRAPGIQLLLTGGPRFWLFKGGSESVQVLFKNSIGRNMVLTFIILI